MRREIKKISIFLKYHCIVITNIIIKPPSLGDRALNKEKNFNRDDNIAYSHKQGGFVKLRHCIILSEREVCSVGFQFNLPSAVSLFLNDPSLRWLTSPHAFLISFLIPPENSIWNSLSSSPVIPGFLFSCFLFRCFFLSYTWLKFMYFVYLVFTVWLLQKKTTSQWAWGATAK